MKTSDKILLYSTLSAIGLFVAVDLSLYAKYRSGDILGFETLQEKGYTRHALAGIKWLVIDGPIHTVIRPGETDSLEFDVNKMEDAHVDWFRRGDTLTIVVKNRRVRSAHDNWFSYGDYASVRVYCPPLKGIHINNGVAVLDNEANRKGISASLVIDSTQLWVGVFNSNWDSVYRIEPWDTMSVRGVNSNFILNRQAHVKQLDLSLDDRSEVTDRFSTVDTGFIQGDTNTNVVLRGRNIEKIRLLKAGHTSP
jgi:hypothetical protein